jgi:hypothetical protein
VKAGILVQGDFTYDQMLSLTKGVLLQMGETKAMFIKEDVQEEKFYVAFFVNKVDALLWGQGGGFFATLFKKEAHLVAAGKYEAGTLVVKVHSGIVSRRSTFSARRLEAIERFYEFLNLFRSRLEAEGKDFECTSGLSEAASDISYRRKSTILGSR